MDTCALQETVFYLGGPGGAQQSVPLAGLVQPVLFRKRVCCVLGHGVGLLLQSQRAEGTTNIAQAHIVLSVTYDSLRRSSFITSNHTIVGLLVVIAFKEALHVCFKYQAMIHIIYSGWIWKLRHLFEHWNARCIYEANLACGYICYKISCMSAPIIQLLCQHIWMCGCVMGKTLP